MTIPRTRLYIYGAVALVASIYLAWSIWGSRPQLPAAGFVLAKAAVVTPKIPGPVVQVKIVPKAVVKAKFPQAHVEDDEEVIDTADIGPAPDGAVAIVTIDPNGEARTEVKMKEAPWFALERQNYLGAGYELHLNGDHKMKLYYKRDLFRIKNAHLQGEVVIRAPVDLSQGKIEGYGGANAELRF